MVRRLLFSVAMAEHDQLFKTIFERQADATSLLSKCLAPEVSAAIDWSNLTSLSPELVGADLERRQSDLVFVTWARGHDARLILLVEHQSSVDEAMPLRAHGYGLRILEKQQRDEPGTPLPIVISVVVYQGPAPWTGPTQVRQMTAVGPPALDAFVPNAHFVLIDLARLTDAELRAKAMSPAATLTVVVLTQCRGAERPDLVLERWFDQLVLVADSVDGVNVLLALGTYLARASAGSPADLRVLFERLGNTGKEAFVTMAEMMGQEARQQGRQEGAVSVLLSLLSRKFGNIPADLQRRVAAGSQADVARWAEQVLDATNLTDALR